MAYKHKLQTFIFTKLKDDNFSNIAADITHLIIQLEIAAAKVQTMAVRMVVQNLYLSYVLSIVISLQLNHFNMQCVQFTGRQYDFFFSRFHNDSTVYSSLKNFAKYWKNKTNNCDKWNKYSYSEIKKEIKI